MRLSCFSGPRAMHSQALKQKVLSGSWSRTWELQLLMQFPKCPLLFRQAACLEAEEEFSPDDKGAFLTWLEAQQPQQANATDTALAPASEPTESSQPPPPDATPTPASLPDQLTTPPAKLPLCERCQSPSTPCNSSQLVGFFTALIVLRNMVRLRQGKCEQLKELKLRMQQYLEKALVTLELTGATACCNFLSMAEVF